MYTFVDTITYLLFTLVAVLQTKNQLYNLPTY